MTETSVRKLTMLFFAAAGAGCSGVLGDDLATGAITVELATGSTFQSDSIARADIFILAVEGMLRGIDSSEAARAARAGTNDDPEDGFVTVANPNSLYNLVDLRRGETFNLGGTILPVGHYLGFRLLIDPAQSSVTLTDGTVLAANTTPGMEWPGTGAVGSKVVLDEPLELSDSGTAMVVDFNPFHAFAPRGGPLSQDGLRFTTVVRGVIKDSTGNISGIVRRDGPSGAPIPDAVVEVLRPGTPLGDTDPANVVRRIRTEPDGTFRVYFLARGTYAARALPPPSLDLYDPVLLQVVTVAASQDANGNLLVLPPK